jgi:hypothetical protein
MATVPAAEVGVASWKLLCWIRAGKLAEPFEPAACLVAEAGARRTASAPICPLRKKR